MSRNAKRPSTGGTGAAQATASARERTREFRRGRRHSWLVRSLKLALPSIALVSISAYATVLLATARVKQPGLDPGTIRIDPRNLTMDLPKYDGFNKDGSQYKVRAKEAITDLKMSGPTRLNAIDGDLIQANGVVTKLKATWGTYDQKKNVLELYEKVDVDGSTGMKARLSRATVHTKENRIVTNEPMTAETEAGKISARSMDYNSRARKGIFRDAVHVRIKSNGQSRPEKPVTQSAVPLGLNANSGQPIEVRSEKLDIDDEAKTALFREAVIAKQGDAILEAPELEVFYEGKAASLETAGKPADGAPAAETQSRLKAIKARGGVLMTNKEDRATGATLDYDAATERGILKGKVVVTSGAERQATAEALNFDQKADTVLMTGDVIVTQDKNVLKGRRMLVDRKHGKTRLESPAEGTVPAGRIASTFVQGDAKSSKSKEPAKADAGAPALGALGASFKNDPNAPTEVEADTLDIDDSKKTALYVGKVVAKQGDTVIKTSELTVFYTGQSGFASGTQPAAQASKAGAGQAGQLTRVEARKKVVITSKDGQEASGDWADMDVKANTMVLGGKVLVAQGKNVIEGPEGARLFIDMNSGVSRFEQAPGASGPWAPQAVSAAGPTTGPAPPSITGPAAPSPTCPPGAVCSSGRMRAVLYPNMVQDAAKKAAEAAGGAKPEAVKVKKPRSPLTSPATETGKGQ